MSKQEVKEEYKQMEGDPLVKNRLRQRMRELLSQNMAVNVPKADVVPSLSAVYALVNPVADAQIRSLEPFAAPDEDGVGSRGGDRHASDGSGRLVVEDREPGPAIVGRFPDPAVVDADEKLVRTARDPSSSDGSSASMGADAPPTQMLGEHGVDGLGHSRGYRQGEYGGSDKRADLHAGQFATGMEVYLTLISQ